MAANCVLSTTLGRVRGKIVNSVRSGTYYSFQGIPYGKPPVGALRFQAPQPAEAWTEIRDALKEGPSSPSLNMITHQYIETSNEDCLYLNVYSPSVSSDEKKAVLFWIHGGGFARGSGDTDLYGPDYLVTEDVVVVTINYRLGALGFLSLENKLCPGNNGLKDVVLALKWVQDNISNFGGDKNNVTIFGESAGGAAVNYLMLSPATKGLFHGAISQSGASTNPWANSRKARIFAYGLAEIMGFQTEDDNELLTFLKDADVRDIVKHGDSVQKKYDRDERHGGLAFVPNVEPAGTEGAFLTSSPYELISKGLLHDVPYMVGAVNLEGGIILVGASDLKDEEGYKKLIPADMTLDRQSLNANQIVSEIKQRYFPNGFTKQGYIDACSSIYFTNGIVDTINAAVNSTHRKSSTYCYQFSYDGGKATLKHLVGFSEFKGTFHGDELGYLWHHNMLEARLEPNTKDYQMVEVLTRLWTNFAKTKNPTSDKSNGVNIYWKPATKTKKYYLDINEELTLREDLLQDEKIYWDKLYQLANNKGKL